MFCNRTVRLGKPVNGSVWTPCSSSACARALARTATTTRRVMASTKAVADTERTMLSVMSAGATTARTIAGPMSEANVTAKRASDVGGGPTGVLFSCEIDGCRNNAPAQK